MGREGALRNTGLWTYSAVFAALAYFRVARVLNVILDSPPE
jgi:hypothetical protein